jgi:hypothetical protein
MEEVRAVVSFIGENVSFHRFGCKLRAKKMACRIRQAKFELSKGATLQGGTLQLIEASIMK